jgi:PAS domain S-box-containing protein
VLHAHVGLLALLLSAGTVLLAGLLLAGGLYYLRAETLASGDRVLASYAKAVEEQTERTIQTIDQALQLSAGQVVDLATGELSPGRGDAVLREQTRKFPYLRALWVVDAQGITRLNTDVRGIGMGVGDRPYFRELMDKPGDYLLLSVPLVSRTSNTQFISASRLLPAARGTPAGVIVASIEPAYFDTLWSSIGLGPSGSVALFKRNGQMMMRSPLRAGALGQDFSASPLFALLQSAPAGQYVSRARLDGLERRYAYRALAGYPDMIVVIGQTEEAMLAGWHRLAGIAAAVWAAAGALIILLGWLFGRELERRGATEARFRRLAELMPGIVLATDVNARVRYANPQWSALTGRDAGQALDFQWTEAVHPEDRAGVLRYLARAARGAGGSPAFEEASMSLPRADRANEPGGGAAPLEYRLLHADGQYRWHLLRGAPDPRKGAANAQIFFISTDIDELRRLNTELEERVAERTRALERVNHGLNEFSYAVAHDLRTPMRAVAGFADLLQQDHAERLDERGREYLARIRRAIDRAEVIINQLLQLARAGSLEIAPAWVDATPLAQEIAARLAQANPDTRTRVDIEDCGPVYADPRLLATILENLIGNAWKYSSRQGEPLITMRAVDTAWGRALCVEDNGTGFKPELAHKMFKPFQRLHEGHDYPGLGIGLAMVKRLIDLHGGRIWGENRPEGGARFCFVLPEAAPVQDARAAATLPAAKPAAKDGADAA